MKWRSTIFCPYLKQKKNKNNSWWNSRRELKLHWRQSKGLLNKNKNSTTCFPSAKNFWLQQMKGNWPNALWRKRENGKMLKLLKSMLNSRLQRSRDMVRLRLKIFLPIILRSWKSLMPNFLNKGLIVRLFFQKMESSTLAWLKKLTRKGTMWNIKNTIRNKLSNFTGWGQCKTPTRKRRRSSLKT